MSESTYSHGYLVIDLSTQAQEMVTNDQPSHCFHHRDSARQDTGIMPALTTETHLMKRVIHRVLFQHQGRSGFERKPQINVFSVGNPPLNTTGAVSAGAYTFPLHTKGIIVLTAAELGSTESASHLKPLTCGNTEHSMPKSSLQFIKNGIPQTDRAIADGTGNHSAQRIALTAGCANGFRHPLGSGGICSANNIGFHRFGLHIFRLDRADNAVHSLNPTDNVHTGTKSPNDGTCNRTCSNTTDSLPSTGTPAPGPCANTIFGIVTVIRVRGTVDMLHLIIGRGAVVFVTNGQSNRRTQCPTIQHTAQDFYCIFLIAWSNNITLSRASAIQCLLNHFMGK